LQNLLCLQKLYYYCMHRLLICPRDSHHRRCDVMCNGSIHQLGYIRLCSGYIQHAWIDFFVHIGLFRFLLFSFCDVPNYSRGILKCCQSRLRLYS
jgi:hypothetical protein